MPREIAKCQTQQYAPRLRGNVVAMKYFENHTEEDEHVLGAGMVINFASASMPQIMP